MPAHESLSPPLAQGGAALRAAVHTLMDEARREEGEIPILPSKRPTAVFVERSTRQWVVRDPEGQFWILPVVEDAWGHRLPFEPTEETGLDPVPGHCKHVLGLPF